MRETKTSKVAFHQLSKAWLFALLEGYLLLAVLALPVRYLFPLLALARPQAQAPKEKSHPEPKEQPVPFHAGETLTYRVSWSVFSNAASLQLTIPERRDLFGSQTWHFRGVAHTLGSVRSLFPIDDQFDSYSDASTLDGRQFETHLNELGKSSNQVLRLAPNGQAANLPRPVIIVPPDTRDALGILYNLRAVDWARTPEFRAPVYDGHDVYEIRASREAEGESTKVDAGTYSASRISIRVFQNQKELTEIRYHMWVASDDTRTPVLMEADLPFGTLRAELTSKTD